MDPEDKVGVEVGAHVLANGLALNDGPEVAVVGHLVELKERKGVNNHYL